MEDVEDEEEDDVEEDEEDEDEDNNVLFVLTIDGIPYFNDVDLSTAKIKMFEIARKLNRINNKDYSNSYIRENENTNEQMNLSVVRHFDCVLFSYDYTLHTLKLYRTISLNCS